MASKFLRTVGGNSSADASWSTTSGGAADTVAPTAADDLFLDANSGNITIDASLACRSINCTGYVGTFTHGSFVITIGDATAGASNIALKFVAGMTYNATHSFSSIWIVFGSTSATVQTIDWGGKATAGVTFNATSNGSWQYLSAHTTGTTSQINLTKGSLDINGQTCSWGSFSSSNTNVRSLTLGAANITITGGSATVWDMGTSTNLSRSVASSTITFSGTTAVFASTGTYGTINFTGAQQAQVNLSFTCATFTRTGTTNKSDSLNMVANVTVTAALTLAGNSSVNRIFVASISTPGTARTFTTTGAVVTATNTDFQDITLSVSKDFSAQTDVGDAGGNSGITFPAGVQQTATGTASFTWSTHSWTTRVPLPQDDVVVNNAFIAGRTITMDMPRLGKSIDFSGCTGNPNLAWSISNTIFGSLTLKTGMTQSGNAALTMAGRANATLLSAGLALGGTASLTVQKPSFKLTLSDDLILTGDFIPSYGDVDLNNKNLTCKTFNASNASTRTLTLGTGTISLISTGSVWNMSSSGVTLSAASVTIVLTLASSSLRTFIGGGKTYGTLQYTVAGSIGELDITGSNTFAFLKVSDASNARTLKFTAATTTTITSGAGWQVFGSVGKILTIASVTAATHTISIASGIVTSDYLNLTNSIATGGTSFYAGANSVDNGGNTGWTFSAAPTVILTGTITSGTIGSNIRAGGKTIILTVTGDTYVASGATFNAQRQAIIDGLVSAQAEAHGWNVEVKAKIGVADVVRTSGTVVTITLDAEAGYLITMPETVTATVPGAALTGAQAIIATPTFLINPTPTQFIFGDEGLVA